MDSSENLRVVTKGLWRFGHVVSPRDLHDGFPVYDSDEGRL